MHPLYEILEQKPSRAYRMKIIENYLPSHDIDKLLPEGACLLNETAISQDINRIFFNYLVGNKYLRDEPYSGHECPVFVLGIVSTKEGKEILVVDPDDGVLCLPTSWMESSEAMMERRQ